MELILKIYLAISPLLAILFTGTAVNYGIKKAVKLSLYCLAVGSASTLILLASHCWLEWVIAL